MEEGLSSFCKADSSLFRRHLHILQRVDAFNPVICAISRNDLFACLRRHRETLRLFTISRPHFQRSCDLCIVRIAFGMVKALVTGHRLREVLNEKHVAKGSSACTYVFIFCRMFRFPGNHATLISWLCVHIWSLPDLRRSCGARTRGKKPRGGRPVRY